MPGSDAYIWKLRPRIAKAAIEHPDEPVRQIVFEVASEKLLRGVI